jgi:hypothetical protein
MKTEGEGWLGLSQSLYPELFPHRRGWVYEPYSPLIISNTQQFNRSPSDLNSEVPSSNNPFNGINEALKKTGFFSDPNPKHPSSNSPSSSNAITHNGPSGT